MSNPELLVATNDDEEEGIKFDIMKPPALDFHETIPASSSLPTKEEEMNVASARKETEEKKDKKKESCAGGDDDADNDGFKTPTSLEHKIPEPKICPPAPRRPSPLKRKASPTNSSNAAAVVVGNLLHLQLDFSKRVKKG